MNMIRNIKFKIVLIKLDKFQVPLNNLTLSENNP